MLPAPPTGGSAPQAREAFVLLTEPVGQGTTLGLHGLAFAFGSLRHGRALRLEPFGFGPMPLLFVADRRVQPSALSVVALPQPGAFRFQPRTLCGRAVGRDLPLGLEG